MLSNTLARRIEWGDCDPAGIVFNPRFFAFFDDATSMLIEAAGWPLAKAAAEFGIVGWPLVATRAEFRAPCAHGDRVTITSSFADVRRSSFDVRHVLEKDGTACVEGFETRVWTRRDAATGRLGSTPIPDRGERELPRLLNRPDRSPAAARALRSDALPDVPHVSPRDWTAAMTVDVPQAILDALTDVDMPRLLPERAATGGDRRRRASAFPSIATAASSSAAVRPGCAPRSSCSGAAATSSSSARAPGAAPRPAPARTSRPCTPRTPPTAATTTRRWRGRSAPAARWTRTPPTSRRSARRARWPRCSISACRCRRTRSAARCATRPTTTRSAARRAAARAPRG